MKRYAALFTLLVLLLAGCGIEEVDITNMPPATAAASAAPSLEPAATPESTPFETPLPDLPADEMVKLVDIIPDIYTDLRYATEDNFIRRGHIRLSGSLPALFHGTKARQSTGKG